MIAEYVRYKITDAARQRELIGAYDAAQKSLLTSPHCLGYELSQCSWEPSHFILRIEWDSHDGHLTGFRQSANFQPFFAAVRPFVGESRRCVTIT
jgi:quinol monooxygenase YgiN